MMELKEFLYIIRRRFHLILYIVLFCTLTACIVSYFVIKPKYKADISVMIAKTDNSIPVYNDVTLYQTMVKTFSKLTTSRIVAGDVIEKLNLQPMKDLDLLSMITVAPDVETPFITITVLSEKPILAMKIANQFAKSLKDVSVKINKVDVVQLIDDAQLPIKKDSPKPIQNTAIAFFLSIMFSIALVFLLEYLDNTIKTEQDVEKAIAIPVVGKINLIDTENNDDMLVNGLRTKKIKPHVSEQFRNLRTNIRFSSLSDGIKSIVVTSSRPSEGKSLIISKLAVAMASSGKRVVILDCDFRNPTIHKRFCLPNSRGLTNILVKDKKIEEIIITTDIPNLYILPSGPIPQNPTELLENENMEEILDELTDNFDIVLIDTPAIMSTTDAQILSALSFGTIIVSSYGRTEEKELLNTKEIIEKVGGKIIGVIINKIPKKANNNFSD